MIHNWKTCCLDGAWELFIAPDESVGHRRFQTAKELETSGFLKIDAQVPGNFELDMQRAGLIGDPFYGMNILKLQELEDRHLWYVKRFTYPEIGYSTEPVFVFEGIDTFAEICLNGDRIGTTDNMLVEFEIPARGLVSGENELVIHISPANLVSRGHVNEFCRPQSYKDESMYARKAPHMYGWDIMPRAVSGGLWRSVYLREKPADRIEDVYLFTTGLEDDKANLRCYFHTEFSRAAARRYTLRLTGTCGESRFEQEEELWHNSGMFRFTVERPVLWWLKDMGEPSLYDLRIELTLDGQVVDTAELRFGIRTVRLERTSLAENGKFCFYLNGQPFFARGANWVPLDAFHSRDAQRLPKALELLDEIGCNMVRCWGGNVYEPEAFFEYCDARGIAVWQDFSMACAAYPQDAYFCEAIRREAEKVVRRLRRHASLFLWAGDNECDESISNPPIRRDPNRNVLTRKVIPDVLYMMDPIRPYLPSSPYMDEYAFATNQLRSTSEQHLWGPRDYFKSRYYTDHQACFASEMGYHGCPSPASIKTFLPQQAVWPWQENMAWVVHGTSMIADYRDEYSYRTALMANQVKTLLGYDPDTLEEFSLASQISQAEAMKFFIESFRIDRPRRSGIIWWNLIDGWPQFSDAVVDYYFVKKAAWSYIKNAQQAVCFMITEPQDGIAGLVGANEHLRDIAVRYNVTALSAGNITAQGQTVLRANASLRLNTMAIDPNDREIYLIEWETEDGVTGRNHYTCAPVPYDLTWYTELMRGAGLLMTEGF